jgi:hypothetical protein
MQLKAIVCAVVGHRWHVDELSQEFEPVFRCARCGSTQLAPNATGFDGRVAAQTKGDRWVGPTGRR